MALVAASSTAAALDDEAVSDDIIRPGDKCIIQIVQGKQIIVVVKPGVVQQTRMGALPLDSLIGRRFGSRVQTKNGRGFVHVFRLTPELWTLNLRHRTQVIYHHDISLIIMMLDLKFNHVVIESGTGSGSLSHALIRAVMPHGHLFTYEFHRDRSQQARNEFDAHGVGDHVTVTHADVRAHGFGLQGEADAVVLDLPMAHEAIGHAKAAMKPGARLCAFCPCIEQIQRMCSDLHSAGFSDIQTMECANRELQPTTVTLPRPNLTCERRTMALESKNEETGTERDVAEPECSVQPGATDEEFNPDSSGSNGTDHTPADSVVKTIGCTKRNHDSDEEHAAGEPEKKRQMRSDDAEVGDEQSAVDGEENAFEDEKSEETVLPTGRSIPNAVLSSLRVIDMPKKRYQLHKKPWVDQPATLSWTAAVFRSAFRSRKMPGHTGYLTFATRGQK